MTSNRARLFGLVMALTLAGMFASAQGQDQADLAAVNAIKEEAFERSQLMDVLSYLTDVYGPRVTGSPNIKKAANYAVVKMREWGISSAGLEPWGPFGKGWSNERFSAHVIEPQAYPLDWLSQGVHTGHRRAGDWRGSAGAHHVGTRL